MCMHLINKILCRTPEIQTDLLARSLTDGIEHTQYQMFTHGNKCNKPFFNFMFAPYSMLTKTFCSSVGF